MAKKWTHLTTNYREAWLTYRKSVEYKISIDAMKAQGINQPYSSNILKSAFAAGWSATGQTIFIIPKQ